MKKELIIVPLTADLRSVLTYIVEKNFGDEKYT